MDFVSDDFLYCAISDQVDNHDISKLSPAEFVQYRRVFFPIKSEGKVKELGEAWEHHKDNSPHHWENWTTHSVQDDAYVEDQWKIHCVHMVADWMAMGYKFGDTARTYYERNKDKIKLPDYAVKFIYDIFSRIK